MGKNEFRFGEEGIVRDRILQGCTIQQKPKTGHKRELLV